jgi:hypothetical protein
VISKFVDGKTYSEINNMFVKFVITGRLYNSNTRFRMSRTTIGQALCINLWNGSIWGVTKEGKRKLLKRVIN